MMIGPDTLELEFNSAMNDFETLNYMDSNSLEFKNALALLITKFEICTKAIENQAIFSKNETIEDIDTDDLKYMILRLRTPVLIDMIQQNRKETVLYCKQLSLQLLHELEARNFQIFKSDAKPSDPRELKIWQFKRERELKSLIRSRSGNDRELVLMQIELEKQRIENLVKEADLELEMLEQSEQAKAGQPNRPIDNDTRVDNLDWRLDQKKALLSQDGKVMQPFVITTEFNKRQELQDGVFGERNLPTMTIEEYLDKEMARGNIIGGGGPQDNAQDDQASEDSEEEDIYKKRAWDAFTDDNPRGWGNRMNKG